MSFAKNVARASLPFCLTAFFLASAGCFLGIALGDNTWEMGSPKTTHLSDFLYLEDWSPLYSHWFKLLTLVFSNPLVRYFASWGILVSALALIPALMRIPRARIYNVILVILPFLNANPFLGLFGSVFVLAGFCVILRREHTPAFAAVAACVTSFLVAFARPEFNYGVYLSAAATLMILLVARKHHADTVPVTARISSRSGSRSALACVSLVALLSSVMLLVMAHSRFSRSGLAFSQHFIARAVEHGLIPYQTWNSLYAVQVFGLHSTWVNLGGLSVFDFLRANPSLFARHVLENLVDFKTLAILSCLLPALLWPWLGRKRHDPAMQRHRVASIYLALMSVPPLLGIIVIYPREHYGIIIAPSLLLFILQMLPLPRPIPIPAPLVFVAACFLIAIVQYRFQPAHDPFRQTERRDLRRLQCVRAADMLFPNSTEPVFDAAALGDAYFDNQRTISTPATITSWTAFQSFTAQSHPLWITADDALLAQYAITQAQLDSFLQGTMRYRPQPCRTTADLRVYIH
jgi:hypothetical protein